MQSKRRGITLLELIISSVLVSLLMLEVWALMSAGSRYYHRANTILELQRSALVTLSWMSRELGEGDPISFRNDLASPTPGFVFGSPRGVDGEIDFNDKGILQWQTMVCYYIETIDGRNHLFRASRELSGGPKNAAPIISSAHGTDFFRTDSSGEVARRLIALDVYRMSLVGPDAAGIEVSIYMEDTRGEYSIETRTKLDMKN